MNQCLLCECYILCFENTVNDKHLHVCIHHYKYTCTYTGEPAHAAVLLGLDCITIQKSKSDTENIVYMLSKDHLEETQTQESGSFHPGSMVGFSLSPSIKKGKAKAQTKRMEQGIQKEKQSRVTRSKGGCMAGWSKSLNPDQPLDIDILFQ